MTPYALTPKDKDVLEEAFLSLESKLEEADGKRIRELGEMKEAAETAIRDAERRGRDEGLRISGTVSADVIALREAQRLASPSLNPNLISAL